MNRDSDPHASNPSANDRFGTDVDSENRTRQPGALKLLALGLIALAGAFALGMWFQAHSATPLPSGPFPAQAPAPAKPIVVQVGGEVAHPGLYSMPTHSRIGDAIDQAGGPTARGDTAALNLAAWAEDGTRIAVPVKGAPAKETSGVAAGAGEGDAPAAETPAAGEADNPPASPDHGTKPRRGRAQARKSRGKSAKKPAPDFLSQHPVDLNTATSEELQQLPGVGPVMADKIVAWRGQNGRFKTPDDLRGVKGIGPKKMDKLRPLVTVG